MQAAAVAGTATERFTLPGEVAELVLLLASATVGNITGTDVLIDGGMVTTFNRLPPSAQPGGRSP